MRRTRGHRAEMAIGMVVLTLAALAVGMALAGPDGAVGRDANPQLLYIAEAVKLASGALMLALAPELVVFGSGARLRFPPPAWLQPLMARRIGVETMDTAAACRTYNVLAAEGRAVVAALLLGAGTGPEASSETL